MQIFKELYFYLYGSFLLARLSLRLLANQEANELREVFYAADFIEMGYSRIDNFALGV